MTNERQSSGTAKGDFEPMPTMSFTLPFTAFCKSPMNMRIVETAPDGSDIVWVGQLHRETPEERAAYEADMRRQEELRASWDDQEEETA